MKVQQGKQAVANDIDAAQGNKKQGNSHKQQRDEPHGVEKPPHGDDFFPQQLPESGVHMDHKRRKGVGRKRHYHAPKLCFGV